MSTQSGQARVHTGNTGNKLPRPTPLQNRGPSPMDTPIGAPTPPSPGLSYKVYDVSYDDAAGALQVLDLLTGLPVRYIPIADVTLLTFTTDPDGPLTFNKPAIEWVLGHNSSFLSKDSRSLKVMTEPPASPIMPAAFVLAGDLLTDQGSVKGVRSEMVFITQADELEGTGLSVQLTYDTETGAFSVLEGWPLQPGALFVLPGDPETGSVSLSVTLTDQTGVPLPFSSVASNSIAPIGWLDENQPPWIEITLPTSETPNVLTLISNSTFTLGDSSAQSSVGLAAPFHFNIVYNDTIVRSPDPILINTTIGDGG